MNTIKRNFKEGLNSLEVFQVIVESHEEISHIRLISHKVAVNWRQVNLSGMQKMSNLCNGITHTAPLKNYWCQRNNFLNLSINQLDPLD